MRRTLHASLSCTSPAKFCLLPVFSLHPSLHFSIAQRSFFNYSCAKKKKIVTPLPPPTGIPRRYWCNTRLVSFSNARTCHSRDDQCIHSIDASQIRYLSTVSHARFSLFFSKGKRASSSNFALIDKNNIVSNSNYLAEAFDCRSCCFFHFSLITRLGEMTFNNFCRFVISLFKKDGGEEKKEGGVNGKKNSPSKQEKDNDDNNKSSMGGNERNEDDDEDPNNDIDMNDSGFSDSFAPKAFWFVLGTIALSWFFYWLSKPRGTPASWQEIHARKETLERVDVYHNYAEFYFEGVRGCFYVGLLDETDHTQRMMSETFAKLKVRGMSDNINKNIKKANNSVVQHDTGGSGIGSSILHHHDNSSQFQQEKQPEENQGEFSFIRNFLSFFTPNFSSDSLSSSLEISSAPISRSDGTAVLLNYIGTGMGENTLYFIGIAAWVVPFIFFPSFVMMLTRSIGSAMAVFQEGSSKSAKLLNKSMFKVEKVGSQNTRFCDIAGMTEAKYEVTELVDFLKHPHKFTRLGAKVPTGALIQGNPGTGKTLLAKAVAGEGGVTCISCTGSDFVELYVGMGALRVRQLFELAKKQKRCVIYIDEIDAIGLKRSGAGHGEKQEQENTLNELLTQLDGFGTHRGEIMVLASTNVSKDQLDPALIRPGRFDRIVNVDPPVVAERVDIFKVHLSSIKLMSDRERVEGRSRLQASKKEWGWGGGNYAEVLQVAKEKDTGANIVKNQLREIKKDEHDKDAAEPEKKERQTSSTQPITALTTITTSLVHLKGICSDDTNRYSTSANAATDGEEAASVSSSMTRDVAWRKLEHAAKSSLEEKLFKLTSKERDLGDLYAQHMSDLCPGFVGADIANVCNEAAILAARESCDCVTLSHLERSIDRVLAGIEHRSRVLSDFEKRVVAHHEAGHAVAGWFLGRADPLMKVSIVPRGGSALGYAQYLPNENQLRTSSEIKDSICVAFGGRVAEEIFFNHFSTGASDDLRKITRMAYQHVSSFNPRAAYVAPGTEATKYVKPFGRAISNKMDEEATRLVNTMHDRTMKLLSSLKREMKVLAEHLLKYEVLTHADVVRYLGKRPERPLDAKGGEGMLTMEELTRKRPTLEEMLGEGVV